MVKFIIWALLFYILITVPLSWYWQIWDFFGVYIFGIAILGWFLVKGLVNFYRYEADPTPDEKSTERIVVAENKPKEEARLEKKSMAQKAIDVLDPRIKSTFKEKMEVAALVALARKFFKKPELTFDDPDVFVENTVPSGLNDWKLTIKRRAEPGSTQLSMSKSRASGNFGFKGNVRYKVRWVEFSLDDLPEKYQKIVMAYLLIVLSK